MCRPRTGPLSCTELTGAVALQEVCLHPLLASSMAKVSLSSALRGLAPSLAVRLASYLLKWLRALDSASPLSDGVSGPRCLFMVACVACVNSHGQSTLAGFRWAGLHRASLQLTHIG